MEERRRDRIVLVTGCRRILRRALFERDKEAISALLRNPNHSLPRVAKDAAFVDESERGNDLVQTVPGMSLKRDSRFERQWFGLSTGFVAENSEQIDQLGAPRVV